MTICTVYTWIGTEVIDALITDKIIFETQEVTLKQVFMSVA